MTYVNHFAAAEHLLVQGRILRPSINKKTGYKEVALYWKGKGTTRTVHSLVAEAFIRPRPPNRQVRHRNGNKLDCRRRNLLYGTPTQNGHDTVRHGHNRNAIKTHCLNGHEFTPENTSSTPSHRRICRECKRTYQREWARQKKRKQQLNEECA